MCPTFLMWARKLIYFRLHNQLMLQLSFGFYFSVQMTGAALKETIFFLLLNSSHNPDRPADFPSIPPLLRITNTSPGPRSMWTHMEVRVCSGSPFAVYASRLDKRLLKKGWIISSSSWSQRSIKYKKNTLVQIGKEIVIHKLKYAHNNKDRKRKVEDRGGGVGGRD